MKKVFYMKKKLAFILAIMILFCSGCGQQVVAHTLPDSGIPKITSYADRAEVSDSETTTLAADIAGEGVTAETTHASAEETTSTTAAAVASEVTTTTTQTTTVTTTTTTSVQTEADEDVWEDEYYYEDEEEEAEEPEYDYDPTAVAEKAKKLNKTADSIRDEISAFLVKAVFGGYGMTLGGEGTFIGIFIEDGVWTVSVDDTECFRYKEEMEWFGYGEADSSTEKSDAEDPDTLLAIALVKKFPDIQNGSAGGWLEDGSCKAAYFTEDTTAGDGQMDYLLGEGGWTEKYCEWDGYNQGMSEESNVVGTSPVLKFAVEE